MGAINEIIQKINKVILKTSVASFLIGAINMELTCEAIIGLTSSSENSMYFFKAFDLSIRTFFMVA
jgi:hypothetical protein